MKKAKQEPVRVVVRRDQSAPRRQVAVVTVKEESGTSMLMKSKFADDYRYGQTAADNWIDCDSEMAGGWNISALEILDRFAHLKESLGNGQWFELFAHDPTRQLVQQLHDRGAIAGKDVEEFWDNVDPSGIHDHNPAFVAGFAERCIERYGELLVKKKQLEYLNS